MTNIVTARQLFGNNVPPAILKRLERLYGTPRLQELEQALLCLDKPMDRNQPVDMMLYTTDEVQMFLMAHPYGYCKLINVNLISYAITKLSKCGGL